MVGKSFMKRGVLLGCLSAACVLSSTVWARMPMTPSPLKPCEGVFMTLQGALVKQFTDHTAYSVFDETLDPDVPPIGPILDINTGYKLSGGGVLGYTFRSGAQAYFSFFINDHSSSDGVAANPETGQFPTTMLAPVDFSASFAQEARSSLKAKDYIFDVAFSTVLHTPTAALLRPYAGLNVTYVKSEQNTRYSEIDNDDFELSIGSQVDVNERSSVTGVGPLFGMNFAYPVYTPVSIEGDVSLAMLLGKVKSSMRSEFFDGESVAGVTYVSRKSELSGVPLFRAKLGVAYVPWTSINGNGQVKLAAGYHIVKYIDTIHTHSPGDSASVEKSMISYVENSGFHGPYLSITWQMA